MGFASAGSPLAPLHANPLDAAMGCTRSASIEADGTVWYSRPAIDPRTGQKEQIRIAIGRVALARFPAGTQLAAVDAQHFSAPGGIVPHIGGASDGNFGPLTPHTIERSGVSVDLGLERLQDAYLALDAMRAASVADLGAQKTAMDLLK